MKEQKKGISLIVLVITIIVMLILASAVIISLSNSNIITKAKEAVTKTNDKVLAEQADLYAADLILEFRQMGYNGLIVPEIAKQTYVNALKDGKSAEEAKKLADASFIGQPGDWYCNGIELAAIFNKGIEIYDPVYQEVVRACELIWSYDDPEAPAPDLELGKIVKLPEDLKKCIEKEKTEYVKYIQSGETEGAATVYEKHWEKNEPLTGLMEDNETNKYYYLTKPLPVRLPRYVYNDEKNKIYDVTKCTKLTYYGGTHQGLTLNDWKKVSKLVLDDNFKVLTENIIPPVTGDCEIILPNTLKTIKKKAFASSSVKKIIIPSNVEAMEYGAFNKLVTSSGDVTVLGNSAVLEELIINKPEGGIQGSPWALNTERTAIVWEP